MLLTIVAVVLVAGGLIVSEALVKPMVADQVRQELGDDVRAFVDREIAELPAPESAAPQQYAVSEAELNQRIAEQADLGPLDEAIVNIRADGIQVNLSAYRVSGEYSAQVVASDGMLALEEGSISGPLRYVVPVEELEQIANDAIRTSITTSNLRVTDVTLVDGEIVLTLEPTGAGNGIPTG